jgi:hypothetical protein
MQTHSPGDGAPSECTVNFHEEPYDSVSEIVVRIVAECTGSKPEHLPPLAKSIDTDALNKLFASAVSNAPVGVKEITAQYQGVTITIRATGDIHSQPSP